MNYFKYFTERIEEFVEGNDEFIIYPFGEKGALLKGILNALYDIKEKAIIDNLLCDKFENIQNLEYLSKMDLHNCKILITSDNERVYEDLRNKLYAVVEKEKCIDLFPLMEIRKSISKTTVKLDEKNERIWIWGTGAAEKLTLRFFQYKHKEVRGVIVDSAKVNHKNWEGLEVFSYEEAKSKIETNELIVCCCPLLKYADFEKCLLGIDHNKYAHFYSLDFGDYIYQAVDEGCEKRFISKPCAESDFLNKDFKDIEKILTGGNSPILRRKTWEWVYIVQTLQHYRMLGNGKKGIGFAVGTEPLPSYFARKHTSIMASDLAIDEGNAKAWASTNQNAAGNIKALWKKDICTEKQFDRYVEYRNINMNDIPADEKDYDFCWSSCAIEHVGSLEKSKAFLKNMLKVLKSGGVAIHTTEFNLSSKDTTIEEGTSVIFRRKDIEEMKEWFQRHGHYIETSYKRKKTEGNSYIDIEPFQNEYKPYHLSLVENGYVATSFAIVVVKDGLNGERAS